MTYGRILRRANDENILFNVLLELTFRCNLDCFFCYNDLSQRGRSMRLDDYVALLDDLAAMQVLSLTLSGGEPLAHPDFFEIGAAARERGFVVRVKSNGHALRGELALRLRDEVDPFLVEISLHGASAETHDRQTRLAGSFDQLLENLHHMRELGIRFKLTTPLTRWNEHEIEDIFAIADSLDVSLKFDPTVTPRDDGDLEPMSITASAEAVRRLVSVQFARARRAGTPPPNLDRPVEDDDLKSPPGKHCGAGSLNVAIDPYGNVYPCVAWRESAGNVHDRSIREIWNDSAVLPEIREDAAAAKRMLDAEGPAGRMMSFCPGLAVALTGRPDHATQPQKDRAKVLLSALLEEKQSAP
jgi:radical SAM protein with 4Fe4S-binding SPASM domain